MDSMLIVEKINTKKLTSQFYINNQNYSVSYAHERELMRELKNELVRDQANKQASRQVG